jgi:hypothetical protein
MFNTLDMGFFLRLFINTILLFVLVKHCYYRRTSNREFFFSFFLFGTGVFIVSYLLRGVEVSMGRSFCHLFHAQIPYRSHLDQIHDLSVSQ